MNNSINTILRVDSFPPKRTASTSSFEACVTTKTNAAATTHVVKPRTRSKTRTCQRGFNTVSSILCLQKWEVSPQRDSVTVHTEAQVGSNGKKYQMYHFCRKKLTPSVFSLGRTKEEGKRAQSAPFRSTARTRERRRLALCMQPSLPHLFPRRPIVSHQFESPFVRHSMQKPSARTPSCRSLIVHAQRHCPDDFVQ